MQINIRQINHVSVAELISDKVEIKNAQDALDIMMNSMYQGAENIMIREKHLIPSFFDLKTGVAGEILQKFSNYNAKLAIIGNFENISSKSLRDFIRESNRTGRINFVNTPEDAGKAFSR
ncbi:DUF4180 domain-containing protein [Sinomicrobium weinanense]|uniref:DUF4180 domain-containing protein n=1 Tax=Sinomicrobium weinanense TaxID=2842200 RepID=A0A926JVB6_9FLAO|nr:DUF4180 domain-containing protein [Sinomicrobium weinanense]MBC9798255.1 DUF4180 domain-containing protein [Sinomicrobium weinanense]MBU3122640.1 DUF4180 domain-containing protein [Sinomicrobium weinanense]